MGLLIASLPDCYLSKPVPASGVCSVSVFIVERALVPITGFDLKPVIEHLRLQMTTRPRSASLWSVESSIPAIYLVSGGPPLAHATDESLEIVEFRDAIAVYAELVLATVALPD